jgi:hypothetical protein
MTEKRQSELARDTPFNELHRAIGRVEGKMDQIIDRFDHEREQNGEREDRIQALERGSVRLHAIAGVIAAITSIVIPLLTQHFWKP